MLVDVKEMLPDGGCEQLLGIQQVGQQGVGIQDVIGGVTVKPETPLPRVGFVGLTDNPAVGPGGIVQFMLTLNLALPPSTVVSVANFPQCGVGTGSEGFDLAFAPPPSPPPPPPPPPPPAKKTPDLFAAEIAVGHLIHYEQVALEDIVRGKRGVIPGAAPLRRRINVAQRGRS